MATFRLTVLFYQIAMLIVGRIVNGLGAAQLLAVFPVYASEVAPPAIRGNLGGLQMVRNTFSLIGLCFRLAKSLFS